MPGRVAVTAVNRIVLPAASAIPPIALPPEIERALRDGAWAVFNLSGGKDSSAALFATMLALDAIGHPRSRRIAVHADLGRAEWDSTPDMVEALAVRAGIRLHVRRRRGGDLIDRWEQRFANGKARYENLEIYNLIGPWSSASLRFCTSEQKAQVLGPFLAREFAGETIVQIIGIRRDESAARSKAPEWKPDDRFARPGNANGTAMMVWHPIVHWATDQVFALHDALGIPLHEAYTCYGSTRLSCRYCVLQSLADAKASASAPTNREALLQLVDLEARSTFSFQPARWLADTAPHLLPTTLRADIERAKRDASERRALEAAMPADLRFCKGWPPRLPTLDEATRIAASRASILARHRLDNRFSDARAVRGRFEQLMLAKPA